MNLNKEKISKNLSKIIEWLVYASVILVPLIFMPQVNSVFAAPKLYVFRVITLIIILLWALKCLFDDKLKVRFSKFFWFVIAYGIVSIINTFVTVNIYTSLFGTYGRFLGIFTVINLLFWIYIVFSFINTREKIIKLMWVSVCTAFLVALYGLLQYFDLFVNFIPWTMDPQERLFATIGHSNHTAAYLGMNLMLLLGLIFNTRNKRLKIALWIGFALLALTLILTASRGGVFAVLIAGIFWMVFILRQKNLNKKTYKYTITGLILVAIMGILLSGPISKLGVVERTTSTISFVMQGNMPDRISWWLSSFEMIGDKPLLGHGLSSFKDVYNEYRRADYRVPEDAQDHITPETAHNEYLNIAATQGMVGFAAYVAMIVILILYAIRYLRNNKNNRDRLIVISLLTGIVVYLVEVFISFGTITTLFFYYTLIGLFVSYINNKTYEFRSHILINIGILLFAILIVFYGFLYSVKFIYAEYHFKQAKIYSSKGDMEYILKSYEKAQQLYPHQREYYTDNANFLFEFAIRLPAEAQETYLQDALMLYAEAIKINQNNESAFMNQGLVFSRLADLNRNDEYLYDKYKTGTIVDMNAANLLIKNNPFYPYKFGITLKFFKQYEDAYNQFKKVLAIRNPYKDTKEQIEELKFLMLSEEQTSDESGNRNSQQQPETAA